MPAAGRKRRKDDSRDKDKAILGPAAKKAKLATEATKTSTAEYGKLNTKPSNQGKATVKTTGQDAPLKMKNKEKEGEKRKGKHRPSTPKERVAKKVKDEEEELSEDDEDMDDFDMEDEDGEISEEGKGKRDVAEVSQQEEEEDESGNGQMERNRKQNRTAEKAEAPTSSSKSREAHAIQKKLVRERKQVKPNAEIVIRGKGIWEQIRRRDLAKSEKHKLIQELCTMINGHIKELVFKHDASRIVQTVVKNGTKEQRKRIAWELKGSYVDLAKSPYGRYLLVKLMHYDTADTKKMIVSEFYGNVRTLIRHENSSVVVEDVWSYASQDQKEQLLVEFYGAEFAIFKDNGQRSGSLRRILEKAPEKRPVIMKSLFDLLKSLVEKGATIYSIVHRALLEYILNATPGTPEIEEFIELVKEKLQDIAFTRDGSRVAMRCIAYGTAKDRKLMIRILKPVASQLACHESGYLVLLAVYDLVDDTVQVLKSLLPELTPNVVSLATHKTGRISLLYPFAGREPRLLHPPAIKALRELDEIRETTSKKYPEIRLTELRRGVSPVMIQVITDNAKELTENAFGCKFVVEVMLYGIGEKQAALEAIAETAGGDPEMETHAIHSPWAAKMFKSLVQGGPYNVETKKVMPIDPPLRFHSTLYSKIKPEIGTWATKEGSFVVTSLLEAEGFEERPELIQILQENKKQIKQAAAAGNKGAAIITKLLEEQG